MTIYNRCLNCDQETVNKKFCSRSCSASYNNKGVRRHGKPPNDCLECGKKTSSSNEKYCSIKCAGISIGKSKRKWRDEKERKRLQNFYTTTYLRMKYHQTPPDADMDIIKEIYLNCPEGYEVDHIVPLSKGGLHHQDNLQYLTISENRSKGNRLDWCPRQDSNLE